MKVYDVTGAERDADWLAATYGARLVAAADAPKKFALNKVQVTEGPATAVVEVRDAHDAPLAGYVVGFYWPDAPSIARLPDLQTRYKDRAAQQVTDANGLTGFGLGSGAYVFAPADGGPHALWVLSHEWPSDVLERVGMLAGTNHQGPLRLTFTLRETPQIVADVPETLRELAWNLAGTPYNPAAAFPAFARAHRLGIPLTGEHDSTLNGVTYRLQGFADGILYAVVGEWGKIEVLPW